MTAKIAKDELESNIGLRRKIKILGKVLKEEEQKSYDFKQDAEQARRNHVEDFEKRKFAAISGYLD
ncbi:MAG: hypothetical protein KKF48_01150 [Nanoarchaeota archaeon]|nr:hypothetical protein [Nanoarchaeota archaeon]MBU1027630.1 hypothetical protein [Nanoarchaeota archaeon]